MTTEQTLQTRTNIYLDILPNKPLPNARSNSHLATKTGPLTLRNSLGKRITVAELEKRASLAKQRRAEEKETIKAIRTKIQEGHSERLEQLYLPIVKKNLDIKIFGEAIFRGESYDRNIKQVAKARQQKRNLQLKLIRASITKPIERKKKQSIIEKGNLKKVKETKINKRNTKQSAAKKQINKVR